MENKVNENIDKILNIKNTYNSLLEYDSNEHPFIKEYKDTIKLISKNVVKLIDHQKYCKETKRVITFYELNSFSNIYLFDLLDAITNEKIREMNPIDVLRDVLYYLEDTGYDISNFHISRCFCINHSGYYLYELNWDRLKINYNRDYIFYKKAELETGLLSSFRLTDKFIYKSILFIFLFIFIITIMLFYILK